MRDAMTPVSEYARTTEWVSRRLRALYRARVGIYQAQPPTKEAGY